MGTTIGIIMGSDSDLQVMSDACRVLEELDIGFETAVISAHRTPHRLISYAEQAAGRGIQIVIAGAGGAAQLPGVTAALTDLPVIGVPIRSGSLEGFDALLSIVQMPRGIPVATVAINGARNAGLLAARILALSDDAVRARIAAYREAAAAAVEEKSRRLQAAGYRDYLNEMGRRSG